MSCLQSDRCVKKKKCRHKPATRHKRTLSVVNAYGRRKPRVPYTERKNEAQPDAKKRNVIQEIPEGVPGVRDRVSVKKNLKVRSGKRAWSGL